MQDAETYLSKRALIVRIQANVTELNVQLE